MENHTQSDYNYTLHFKQSLYSCTALYQLGRCENQKTNLNQNEHIYHLNFQPVKDEIKTMLRKF